MKKLKSALLGLFCTVCLLSVTMGWCKNTDNVVEVVEELMPYAQIFQQQAPILDWDWHLLASVAWHESHFNPRAHSRAGACGVMQLMPKTASKYGLDSETIWDPQANIEAGVQYLSLLQDKWSFISTESERTKFVLASYNAGHGSVFKARRLAKEAGANPYRWDEVEPFMNQRVTKHYVNQVLHTANKFKQ